MAPANTGAKQGGRFKAGQSGNPAGKPKGARHKTTLAVQALLDGEAEEVTRKVIEAAKSGDMTAIRLVLERILPPRKDAPVVLSLPPINNPADGINALTAIMQAVSLGEITPAEGNALSSIIEQVIGAHETQVIEKRLEALEAAISGKNKQ